MWMMGCRDVSESFNAPKVAPHIPRPSTFSTGTTSSTTTNAATPSNHPSYLSRIHGTDLLLLNHHFEQNKRDFSGATGLPTVVSSRWNPTPEQLQTLEELYRRGTRTPSADQIQHITAQLRRYGKIEGKNVFYWFQNHKARERQKRRRRSKSKEEEEQYQHQQLLHNQSLESKASGSSRTSTETELQAKNWGFTATLGEESFSMQRAERIQFEEAQQVQQRRLVDRHATWQMMEQMMKLQKTSCPSTTLPIFSLHSEKNLNRFEKPHGGNEEENEESPTLELFPVRKGDDDERVADVEEKVNELLNGSMMNSTNTTPQFFEFL